MKAMIYSDLLAIQKPLRETLLILVVLVLAIWLFAFDSPLLIVYAAPLEALIALQYFITDGNQGPWERGRIALPVSRAHIVAGRYLTLALIVTATVVLITGLYLIVCAIHFAFPALADIVRIHTPFDASLLALSVGGSLALSLVELGIMLPFMARESSPASVRFAMAAAGLAITVCLYVLSATGIFARGALVIETTVGHAVLLAGGLVVMGAAFYVASETIALRFYNKREF